MGQREVLLEEVRGWRKDKDIVAETWDQRQLHFVKHERRPCVIISSIRSITIETFVKSSLIAAHARDVFAWHKSPNALKTLIPPWERVTIEQSPASLEDGAIAVLVMHTGPLKQRWVARHRDFVDRGEAGGEFTDEQVSGPFASWVHRHIVRANGPTQCMLEDRIEYAVPLGWIGQVVAGWYVQRKLEKMFDYRHDATIAALQAMGKIHDK